MMLSLLQAVFSVTETLSSCLIVPVCDVSRCPTPQRSLTILTLALFHIISAGYDQFAEHVLMGGGAWHQRSRDLAFMAVDVLHVVMATCWLRARRSRDDDVTRDELLLCVVCLLLLCVLALVT